MSGELSIAQLVQKFHLSPLEGEGGYFRRTWVRVADASDKPEASCILYLITPDSFSALHRLAYDEMFHFYLGDPCQSITMNVNGALDEVILGQEIGAGMKVQHLVSGGTWQAKKLVEGGRYALLGTTMSPGFHLDEFELGTSELLEGMDQKTQDTLCQLIANHHV